MSSTLTRTQHTEEEWREIMTELAGRDRWIIDGNYSRTMDVRARAADIVVFLDDAPIANLARAPRLRVLAQHFLEGLPEAGD